MARRWRFLAFGVLLWAGCGGPSVCDCEQESQKADPDVELLEECAELMEGKSFEEAEKELAECG